jgi:hypothetical protein
MAKILNLDDPGAWLRGRKRRKKPLSAQAKPGRPSGVDKKKRKGERARGRARGFEPGVHRQRLVCVVGHVRLALGG